MTMTRSIRAVATLTAACAVAAASTAALASGAKDRPVVVALHNIRFTPSRVRIPVGGSVTWHWEDADIDTEHNVTSVGPHRFKSAAARQSGSYTITFNRAGVYRFECTIHPQTMQGKVVVGPHAR